MQNTNRDQSADLNTELNTDLNNSLGFVIHDVARLMRWNFDRKSQDLGLTRSQWSVLASLRRCDGAQQKTLASLLDIAPISLARHIDRLQQDGWVTRQDDPDDRRAKRVFLTNKALAILAELQTLGQQVRAEALAGITPAEEQQLLQLLLRMRANLALPANPDL
ncbi:MarR family transcriptional regulator [Gammaproteobacteria bacterium LSUCC0112]|nr:MarR family transcriptional regulator [Gammaproteobacteria bacterium LSUCC0112]